MERKKNLLVEHIYPGRTEEDRTRRFEKEYRQKKDQDEEKIIKKGIFQRLIEMSKQAA